MTRSFLSALLLVLSSLMICRAQDPIAAFDRANRAYEAGKYPEAIDAYKQVVTTGRASAALYYNLGNAYFKAHQLGKAIQAYERAKALSPRDPDLIANLRFARNQVEGATFTPTRADLWLARLSLNEWTILAFASGWLCLLAVTLPFLRPTLKPILRGWTITFAMCTAGAGACLALAYQRVAISPIAVVTGSQAAIHQAPLAESPETLKLNDGAEVRVLDSKDEWLQVTTDPRRVGWVRRSEVALLNK